MLSPTHQKMATIIYDQFLPSDQEMISKSNFVKGSSAPDFIKSYKIYGHNILESRDFFIELVHVVIDTKHSRQDLGFLMGTVTHFIADYACTYHANPKYIEKNIAEHLLYEYKIEQVKVNPKTLLYSQKHIHSIDTLKEDLDALFELNKDNLPNPKRDLIQAILLMKRMCDLMIYEYKKRHIIEERKISNPPKIAIFTDTFYPQINGVSNTLYQYLKYLDFHHIPYILISPKYKENYMKVESHMSIERVGGIRLFFYKDSVISLPIFKKKKLYKILDEFKPTIIHNMTEFTLGHFGVKYAKKRGIPFVTNFSTNFVEYLPYYKLGFLKGFAWKFFRNFHNQSHMTFCPSNTTKLLLESKNFKHVELFGRGIEQELFSPDKFDLNLRQQISAENKYILLYVGRISKEKHLDTLIESYKLLSKDHKDIQLVIVGDGPYLHELKSKSPKDVIFPGYKTSKDLQSYYASSDLFVFPSPSETLGNVVLEAMSSGLPVVGVNAGGVKENIIPGYNGYLTEVDDIKEMAQTILMIKSNQYLSKQLKANALDFTKKKSWPNVFNKLLNKYQDLSFNELSYRKSLD